MNKPGVISLITENARSHGVHDSVTDSERKLLCTVKSVTRSEYYYALNAGMHPQYVFVLAVADEYHGERLLKYRGLRFSIIRTYETDDGELELTAERSDVHGEDTDDAEDDDTGNNDG